MRSHPSAVSTCMLLQPGPHGPNHDCHPILRPLHHRRLRHLSAPGSTGFASPPRRQTPRRPRSCAVRSSKYLPIRKKPTRRTWTNGSVMGGGRVKVIAALPASRDHRRDRAGRGIEEPPIGRLLISLGGCALTRTKFLEHFANLAPCLVAMEACGGTQHWARRLRELGHESGCCRRRWFGPSSVATRAMRTTHARSGRRCNSPASRRLISRPRSSRRSWRCTACASSW